MGADRVVWRAGKGGGGRCRDAQLCCFRQLRAGANGSPARTRGEEGAVPAPPSKVPGCLPAPMATSRTGLSSAPHVTVPVGSYCCSETRRHWRQRVRVGRAPHRARMSCCRRRRPFRPRQAAPLAPPVPAELHFAIIGDAPIPYHALPLVKTP